MRTRIPKTHRRVMELWPTVNIIEGEGEFALLDCDRVKITLWETLEEAEEEKEILDRISCGAFCSRRHAVKRIPMD